MLHAQVMSFSTRVSHAFDIFWACCICSNNRIKYIGFYVRNGGCFTDTNTLKLLYVTIIRSKLECACVIMWPPIYQLYTSLLESVQVKYIKYTFLRCYEYYNQRGCDNEILLDSYIQRNRLLFVAAASSNFDSKATFSTAYNFL